MSASIMWRPSEGAKSLEVMAPSSFLEAMEKVFGGRAFTLNEHSVARLRAMAATWPDKKDNPFERLADIVEKHGEVEVWAEY